MKGVKVLLGMCLAVFATAPVFAATITLFTWPDYIDPEVLDIFRKETGIRVHQINYETDDLKDDVLLETGGEGFDVICSASWSMNNYAASGWLMPLDMSKVPNESHIAPWVRSMSLTLKGQAVPYLWGTMGIAWRKDKYPGPVDSWMHLLAPAPALHGRILMFSDAPEMTAMGLKAAGAPAMSEDPAMLFAAEKLLLSQRPHVMRYGYEDLSEKSMLVQGKAWMAPLFNGDALLLKSFNANIEFVIPKEGSWLWVDHLAVLKKSRNPEASMQFINFMQRPDIAAKNSVYLNYATTNAGAWPLVPKAVLNNPLIYPPEALRKKSEFIGNLPVEQVARRNAIVNRIVDRAF